MAEKNKYSLHDCIEVVRKKMSDIIAQKSPGEVKIRINLSPEGGIGDFRFSFEEKIK